MLIQRILPGKFGAAVKGMYKFSGVVDLVSGWDTPAVNRGVAEVRRVIGNEANTTGLAPLMSVDTEFPVWGDRSVALIQVGNPEYAMLVRTRIGKRKLRTLPRQLCALLRDPSIEKVGSRIKADVTKINTAWPDAKIDAEAHNYMELKPIVLEKCPTRSNKYGLKDMCKSVLGYDLDKSPKLQCSDWRKGADLTEDQIRYAAGNLNPNRNRNPFGNRVPIPFPNPTACNPKRGRGP